MEQFGIQLNMSWTPALCQALKAECVLLHKYFLEEMPFPLHNQKGEEGEEEGGRMEDDFLWVELYALLWITSTN